MLSRVRDTADDAAWREFEARYGELIIRYARARGLRYFDAEDIRQLVLGDLARSLRTFQYSRERGRFRSYLGRIVQRAVSRSLARPNGPVAPLDASEAAPDGGELDGLWEQEWIDHHYRRAMASIRTGFDARSVEVFERLVGGRPVEEVAGQFGMTTQAVHKVKQRIRDRLKELIAAQVRDEEGPDE